MRSGQVAAAERKDIVLLSCAHANPILFGLLRQCRLRFMNRDRMARFNQS